MTDRDRAIADFIARRGATICKPAESFADQAPPIRRARAIHEKRLTEPEPEATWEDEVAEHERERERATERRYLEIQGVRD